MRVHHMVAVGLFQVSGHTCIAQRFFNSRERCHHPRHQAVIAVVCKPVIEIARILDFDCFAHLSAQLLEGVTHVQKLPLVNAHAFVGHQIGRW